MRCHWHGDICQAERNDSLLHWVLTEKGRGWAGLKATRPGACTYPSTGHKLELGGTRGWRHLIRCGTAWQGSQNPLCTIGTDYRRLHRHPCEWGWQTCNSAGVWGGLFIWGGRQHYVEGRADLDSVWRRLQINGMCMMELLRSEHLVTRMHATAELAVVNRLLGRLSSFHSIFRHLGTHTGELTHDVMHSSMSCNASCSGIHTADVWELVSVLSLQHGLGVAFDVQHMNGNHRQLDRHDVVIFKHLHFHT